MEDMMSDSDLNPHVRSVALEALDNGVRKEIEEKVRVVLEATSEPLELEVALDQLALCLVRVETRYNEMCSMVRSIDP
jgi:hypothetical protein